MYKHTQIGKMLVSVVGLTALITGIAGILAIEYLELAPAIILFSISGITLICLTLFSTLTIIVKDDLVIVKYGIGLIQKRFHIHELESWQAISYKGGHGFGPRLTAEGWFFNVSNSGAVRFDLKNGKTFFAGTNEPSKLAKAISVN